MSKMLRCQNVYENCQEIFYNVKLLEFNKSQIFLSKDASYEKL